MTEQDRCLSKRSGSLAERMRRPQSERNWRQISTKGESDDNGTTTTTVCLGERGGAVLLAAVRPGAGGSRQAAAASGQPAPCGTTGFVWAKQRQRRRRTRISALGAHTACLVVHTHYRRHPRSRSTHKHTQRVHTAECKIIREGMTTATK
jgi:hypothetical protein